MAVQTEREPQTVGELIRFWRTQRRLTQMEWAFFSQGPPSVGGGDGGGAGAA